MKKVKKLDGKSEVLDSVQDSPIEDILDEIKKVVALESKKIRKKEGDIKKNNLVTLKSEFLIHPGSEPKPKPTSLEFATLKSLIQLVVREELDKRGV